MPALPSVPKAIRVVATGLIDGVKPWVNAWHYGYAVGAAISPADLLAMVSAVSTGWGANIAPNISDTVSLLEIIGTALDSPSAPVEVDTTLRAGALTTQSVAADTSMVIQRKVQRRYRGGHSRVYVPGQDAAQLQDTERTWNPAQVVVMIGAWVELEDTGIDALVAAGMTDAQSINVSYYEGFTNVLYPSGRYHAKPTLRGTPLIDPIVDFSANPRACSQRRRAQL